mgnify:CR=1 FL=1
MSLPLKLGFRAILRNARFALVNLLGLAVAMAAAFMIGLFVLHETDYDRWIAGADDIHLAATTFHLPGRGPSSYGAAPGPLAGLLEKEAAATDVTRVMSRMPVLQREAEPVFRQTAFVDSNFFEIFDLPARAGDPNTALSDPRSLVLTESAAREVFGTADAIGRVVSITLGGEVHNYRVGAILADLPANTHLSEEIFAPLNEADFRQSEPYTFTNWGSANMRIYARLSPGVETAAFTARVNAEVEELLRAQLGDSMPDFAVKMTFLALPDIHLAAGEFPGIGAKPPGDPTLLAVLSLVALLILAMAMVNYINLATAIALRRMREVALRRTFGAGRAGLLRSTIVESAAIALVAGLLSLALAELCLPWLAKLPGVEMSGLSTHSAEGIGLLLAISLLTGLIAGIAPALTMARFRPVDIFAASGSRTGGGGNRLRKVFVVLQFATSIGLVAATVVIFRQGDHLRSADVHYDRENMIAIDGFQLPDVQEAQEVLAERLSETPGIVAFGLASNVPGMNTNLNSEVLVLRSGGERQEFLVNRVEIGFGFLEAIGARPLAGRRLSRDFAVDDDFIKSGPDGPANILLNEAAVRAFGIASPQAAIGAELRFSTNGKSENVVAHVVGVLPNLRFGSLAEPPKPTYYLHGSWGFRHAIARYRGIGPADAMERLAAVWQKILPDTPFEAAPVETLLADHIAREETQGRLLGAFALVAVALASVGIYGIAAFTAQRRAQEMAVRRVFGASTARLLRMILGRFLGLVGIGGLIGIPVAAFLAGRWLTGFSERIVHGPGPYLLALALAAAVALASVAIEAWRVARIAPAKALRQE